MRNIYIQPSLLHRVSPVPIEQTDLLYSEKLQLFFENLRQMEQNTGEICDNFTDLLFDKIQSCQHPKDRNKLLNCKRAIHNRKKLKRKEELVIREYLNEKEQELLDQYHQRLSTAQHTYSKGEELFKEALVDTRQHFQGLIRDNEALIQSLQLSSQSLFSRLERYLNTTPDKLKKTDIQSEAAFLKYFTRQYTKTSPFSRFTCLSMGLSPKEKDVIKAKVRLNTYLLPYMKGLLLQVPDIVKNIPLKLNPTLEIQEKVYSYLVNFNNVEVFQHIDRNLGLDHIISYIEGDTNIKVLSQNLTEAFEQTQSSDIEQYLLQLIDTGLIEPNINVSGTDPEWTVKFLEFLHGISLTNPDINRLKNTLESLQDAAFQLNTAETLIRQQILDRSYQALKDTVRTFCANNRLPFSEGEDNQEAKQRFLNELNRDTSFRIRYFNGFYFSRENLFYEDASISKAIPYTSEDIKPLVQKLDKLYQILLPLSPLKNQNKKRYHFFRYHYPNKESVPLIEFYKHYYREYVKPNKEGKNTCISEILEAEKDHWRQEEKIFKNHFNELIKDKTSNNEQINFSGEELRNVFGRNIQQTISYSKGTHVQLYGDKHRKIYGVVNSVFNGYGRGHGRFLHLFSKTATHEIRQMNHTFLSDSLATEIKDASCFNANIHPPLLPYEIVIPGGNTNLPVENQISIRDLMVRCESDSVYLVDHSSGKKILPFDLCLQTATTRSELYQLLVSFSPSIPFAIYPLQNWLYEYVESNSSSDDVISFPRVVFEDQLILFRKCWKVPCKFLPDNAPSVSDFEYWYQLKRWRNEYAIPQHCFIFITPYQKQAGENSTFDDYKPQYIDFESPLMVRLFRKAVRKAGTYIRIEEMLPGKAEVPGGAVSEMLIQWYSSSEKNIKTKMDTLSNLTVIY